ncbi:hypothetical protein PFZ49_16715, partial [Microbacterium lacticum]|uniref:hypothetical protein n=1 Tax=Microbacterium lacticum TaxID=33885 RepID=UPI003A8849E4
RHARGVALTGNTPGPESEYRPALNRNNQWPSRLQILSHGLEPRGAGRVPIVRGRRDGPRASPPGVA